MNALDLFSRREWMLRGAAAVAAMAGIRDDHWGTAFGQSSTSITATPAQTEGPYFIDEKLNRSDIRTDPASNTVALGFPLILGITISRLAAGVVTPISGANVDIWHCNASGVYSDEQANGTVGQKFLRGYQVTNAHGNVRFLTVYPGWYAGRTVHIHVKVRMFNGSATAYEFTSQLYFDESITKTVFSMSPYNLRPNRDTTNATDGIYTGGGSGAKLMLRLAQDGSYGMSSFHIALNV